jgi:DNA-binding response OmpR family regulator
MAKVFLTCMEESVAKGLMGVLAIEKHRIEQMPPGTRIDDFLDADIVFAGDDARQYVPLLRGVRLKRPALPFIVVTRFPDTSKWLDALEAGASDYCSAPFESRQIHWLMESVIPRVWDTSVNVGHGLRAARLGSPPVTSTATG